MIPERYLVSAIAIDGKYEGERITGYYTYYEHMGRKRHIMLMQWPQVYCNSYDIDPATIQPVRMKPIKIERDKYHCPNCNFVMNPFGQATNYCSYCGMALEWEAQ